MQEGPRMTHDHDTESRGRILGRREVLALLGGSAGAAFLVSYLPETLARTSASASGAAAGWMAPSSAAATDTPSCIVRPEPSDGSMREGTPLTLSIAVGRIDGASCTALAGVVVDIWHCDATGTYSD